MKVQFSFPFAINAVKYPDRRARFEAQNRQQIMRLGRLASDDASFFQASVNK